MDEKFMNDERNDDIEVDLVQLWKAIKKNIRFIFIATFSLALLVTVYTSLFIPKKYASESTVFLTPKVNESGYIDQGTVNSNNNLINTYISIIKGDSLLTGAAEKIGNDITVADIKGSLSVTNDSNTQIIRIKSVTKNPQLSKDIVETVVNQFSIDMLEKLNIKNISIIDYAKVNNTPVSPSKTKNAILGACIGFVLSSGLIIINFIFDNRLRNKNEAESFLGIPVLAEIPWYED